MEIDHDSQESQDSFYSAKSYFSSSALSSTSSFFTANYHFSPCPSIAADSIDISQPPFSPVSSFFTAPTSSIHTSSAPMIVTSSTYFPPRPSANPQNQTGAGSSHSEQSITLYEVERAGAFKRSVLDIDLKPSSSTNDFRLFLTLLREKLLVLFPRLLKEYHGAKVWLAIHLKYSSVKDVEKTVPGFLTTTSYILHNEFELENTADEICKKVVSNILSLFLIIYLIWN